VIGSVLSAPAAFSAGLPPGSAGLTTAPPGLAPAAISAVPVDVPAIAPGTAPALGPARALGAVPAKPPSRSSLDKQITSASNQLQIVIEQYDTMRVTIGKTKQQIAAIDKDLAPLQQQTQAARAQVGVIAAAVYQHASPIATLGGLLDTATTSQFVNQLSVINQVARTRNQRVDALNSVTNAYLAQKQRLTVLEYTQNKQYSMLKAKRTEIKGQIASLRSLRLAAYGSTGAPPTQVIHYVPLFTGPAGAAVKFAYDQLGKAYRFGAAGPDAFDCSGLTMRAWQQLGVNLPHSAAEQYQITHRVDRSDLQPGDLVFYYHPVHHVAIYIGAGKVIAAPTYGEPVKISPLGLAPIAGYGRP